MLCRRFLGCKRKECLLCKNNPNKKCSEGDNFDECYADNQTMKSKCEADVHLEVVNASTGQPVTLPGVELVVSGAPLPTAGTTALTNGVLTHFRVRCMHYNMV